MIGLIVLALLGIWLLASTKIATLICSAFKINRSNKVFNIFLSFIIIVLPFSDEIVGRIQFQKLCSSEAKVWIAPNIKNVTAAHLGERGTSPRPGYVFPISEQFSIYLDAHTGEPFYKYKAFHTPGGWVMRSGLNMGNSSSCWPDRWMSQEQGFDIDKMLENGKYIDLPESAQSTDSQFNR